MSGVAVMQSSATIVMIDRNPRNRSLFRRFLQEHGFEASVVEDVKALDALLAEGAQIGMVLIDLSGLARDVWKSCEVLNQRRIPFVAIAPRWSSALQSECHAAGARALLVKPLSPQLLLKLIRNVLSE